MTGLEIIKAPGTTAEQIADIIAEHCPPVAPEKCDHISCRECWLAWLTTGSPPQKTESPEQPVAPLDLTRLRKLLQELDIYVAERKGSPSQRATQSEAEELARLEQLLKEADDYITGKPHDHI